MGDIFDQATKQKQPTGDIFDQATATPPVGTPPVVPKPPAQDNRSSLQKFAEDPNPIPLDSFEHTQQHALYNLGQGVAQAGLGGWNLLKTAAKAWNDPKADVGDAMLPRPAVEQVPGAIKDINASPDPLGHYANVAENTAAQGGTQALTALATEGAMKAAPKILSRIAAPPEVPVDLVRNTYSPVGDHISSALRSNTSIDVPAEAKIAAPAIEEGLNDRGITTKSFKGRNGPAALQAGIDNAIDIHEARAKAMIDPIRSETVDPQVLAQNPDLAARFADHKGPITYGDLDAMRIQLNKELRMGNFYSKPPSAQYAIQDPLQAAHQAANQARDLVYGKVGERTGLDIGPLKRTESALIKLGDIAEKSKNTLAPKEAQFKSTGPLKRLQGAVQGAFSVKANPVNAFSIPEKAGLFNPLNEFNSHMQKAFPNLTGARALENGKLLNPPRLSLTSPEGTTPPAPSTPSPVQQIMNLSGGEHVPGVDLKLTSPGDMPPDAQRPLSFMEGPSPNQSGPVAPGGTGTAPLEKLIKAAKPAESAGVPRSLGAAAATPATLETPGLLREAAGLDRRATPRLAPMSATELEAAIKQRKPIQTPFDVTEGAMDTINRDPAMQRIKQELFGGKQGGHAGGGVSSVEELNRPGINYVVDSHGKLTYHGKAFAPENTPQGAAHVTVLPDGQLRVNAGNLTPAMERAIENGTKK